MRRNSDKLGPKRARAHFDALDTVLHESPESTIAHVLLRRGGFGEGRAARPWRDGGRRGAGTSLTLLSVTLLLVLVPLFWP